MVISYVRWETAARHWGPIDQDTGALCSVHRRHFNPTCPLLSCSLPTACALREFGCLTAVVIPETEVANWVLRTMIACYTLRGAMWISPALILPSFLKRFPKLPVRVLPWQSSLYWPMSFFSNDFFPWFSLIFYFSYLCWYYVINSCFCKQCTSLWPFVNQPNAFCNIRNPFGQKS